MKRKSIGQFLFTVGIILIVIQTLILVFNIINGTMPDTRNEQFVFVEDITFMKFISTTGAGIAGTLLLMAVYVRRALKGPDATLTIVGLLLWIVQFISLYDTSVELGKFLLSYIIGIVGFVIVSLIAVNDFNLSKK